LLLKKNGPVQIEPGLCFSNTLQKSGFNQLSFSDIKRLTNLLGSFYKCLYGL